MTDNLVVKVTRPHALNPLYTYIVPWWSRTYLGVAGA